MIYILVAVFITGLAWGFAALASLPSYGIASLTFGSGVVVVSSLAWVMVAVHMLDVGIAPLQSGNHTFLKRFAEALRPSMLDLVVAIIGLVGIVLIYNHLQIPPNVSGIYTVPIFAIAIKWVLFVRPKQRTFVVRWRARVAISIAYLALAALALYLLVQAESARLQTWAYVWVLISTGALAAACYLSAANFRASVLHGQVLHSPTIAKLKSRVLPRASLPAAADKQNSKRWGSSSPKISSKFPSPPVAGGKRKTRKR